MRQRPTRVGAGRRLDWLARIARNLAFRRSRDANGRSNLMIRDLGLCALTTHSTGVTFEPDGVSPSGKAPVFGTGIPRFESWHPSPLVHLQRPGSRDRARYPYRPTSAGLCRYPQASRCVGWKVRIDRQTGYASTGTAGVPVASSGSRTVNVVPSPTADATSMRPPCAVTTSWEMNRPRPNPPFDGRSPVGT